MSDEKNYDDLTDEQLEALLKGEEVDELEADAPEAPVEQPETEEPEEQEEVEEVEAELEVEGQTSPVQKEETNNNDKAFNGIRKELTHERERRRQAEDDLRALNLRIAELEKAKATVPVADELSGYDDDDVVAAKDLRTVLQRQKELEKRLEEQDTYMREKEHMEKVKYIQTCEEKARKQYSKENVGEYDYDTVRLNGFMPMAQANPDLLRIVMNSENPADEAYKIGLTRLVDPYTLIAGKVATPQQAKRPSVAPKTLGSVPASGGARAELNADSLSERDISKLSDKDLDRLLSKMK